MRPTQAQESPLFLQLKKETELFATRPRYSGYAISYNIAFTLFGGFSPMVATLLIQETSDLRAPAYCLIAGALIGLASLIDLKE